MRLNVSIVGGTHKQIIDMLVEFAEQVKKEGKLPPMQVLQDPEHWCAGSVYTTGAKSE